MSENENRLLDGEVKFNRLLEKYGKDPAALAVLKVVQEWVRGGMSGDC